MENQQFSSLPPQPQISSLPGIGDLLKRSWQIYKERIWVFLGVMILPGFIILINEVLMGLVGPPMKSAQLLSILLLAIFFLGLLLVVIFISLWSGAALLYAVKERKEKIGIKESFTKGWHKVISYFWISFLAGLITLVGLLFFIIPGIIFFIWFGLSIYVLIAEDLTGTRALSRSKKLVNGYWWKVFWRFSAIGIIGLLLYLLFAFIVKSVNFPQVISAIFPIFITPFTMTYSFLIYEDLRKIKERVSI